MHHFHSLPPARPSSPLLFSLLFSLLAYSPLHSSPAFQTSQHQHPRNQSTNQATIYFTITRFVCFPARLRSAYGVGRRQSSTPPGPGPAPTATGLPTTIPIPIPAATGIPLAAETGDEPCASCCAPMCTWCGGTIPGGAGTCGGYVPAPGPPVTAAPLTPPPGDASAPRCRSRSERGDPRTDRSSSGRGGLPCCCCWCWC